MIDWSGEYESYLDSIDTHDEADYRLREEYLDQIDVPDDFTPDDWTIVNTLTAGPHQAVEGHGRGEHSITVFGYGETSVALIGNRVVLRIRQANNWVWVYLPIDRAEFADLAVSLHIEDMADLW